MHRDWSGLCHLGSALTYRDIHAHSRHTESLPPGGDPPRLRESNRQGQTAPPRGGAHYSVLLLPAETSDNGWMSSLIAKSSNRPKASSSYSPSTGGPAGRAAARLRRGRLTTTTSSSAGTSVAGAGTFSTTASATGSGVGITKTVPTSGAASATGADAARDARRLRRRPRGAASVEAAADSLSTAETSSAAESTTGTSWRSGAAGVSIGRSCCRSALLDASSPEDVPVESDSIESAATVSSSSWWCEAIANATG